MKIYFLLKSEGKDPASYVRKYRKYQRGRVDFFSLRAGSIFNFPGFFSTKTKKKGEGWKIPDFAW